MIDWNDKKQVEIFKEEERILKIATQIKAAYSAYQLPKELPYEVAEKLNAEFKQRVQERIKAYKK